MIEIGTHNVASIEIETTKSGTSQWVTVSAYDKNGDRLYEITNFSAQNGAIDLKLGTDEYKDERA